jgi:hypothetical protein
MVRVPLTHTSNHEATHGDLPPPMLAKGMRWQEEYAAEAADGIVLPCWWSGEAGADNMGEPVDG